METVDPNAPRRSAMRELREMVPPELTKALVDADFSSRYYRLCDAHPPRVLSVTGPQRGGALQSLQNLGWMRRSPGGNLVISVPDQPPGVEFQVCWRNDTQVDLFLMIVEGGARCGSNFAILAHAARTTAPAADRPTHPRPYAGSGEELRAIVAETLALALDVGRRFTTRPGSGWQAPATPGARMQARLQALPSAGIDLARRAARHPRADARDLSPQGVSRTVLKSTLRTPRVLGPATVGVFGGATAAMFGFGPVGIGLAAGGAALGLGVWLMDFGFHRRKYAAEYVDRTHDELAWRLRETLSALQEDLGALDFQPGLEQIAQLKDKHAAFAAMLGRKLNRGELTHARYLAMSEQVFLAALDNLARIVDTLDGMSPLDIGHISRRLRHLETDGVESTAQDAEIRTLKDRLQLLESRRERVEELRTANEVALTQLAQATAAIADMDTSTPTADVGLEAAMRELRSLVERAPAYSRK